MKNYYLLLFLLFGFFGKAQIVNIPDVSFRMRLIQANPGNTTASTQTPVNDPINHTYTVTSFNTIDTNGDNQIQVSEAQAVKYLSVSGYSISNLTGIEAFTNLQYLNCSSNQLTALNVSNLTNLRTLNCSTNQIPSLNVTGLTNLKHLYCSVNQLPSINVSGLSNFQLLHCSYNQMTSLNLLGLTNLQQLDCSGNQLSSLNVSSLMNLVELNCASNQIPNLNVSGLTNLEYLSCSNNQIPSLNVLGLTNLKYLFCSDNQLPSLNVLGLTNLERLLCKNNQLPNLNVSGLTNLEDLDCSNNQLTSLFLKNANTIWNNLVFSSNPNLQYICADEEDLALVQNKINQYGMGSTCHVNSYCSFTPEGTFYTIQGQNKFDNENDGCDTNDGFFPNLKYSISNGTTTGQLISNNTGNYSIPVQSGTHTVTPILENPSYFTISPTNAVVNFPVQASPFTQNFCVTPNGEVHDVEVSIIPTSVARPGFDCHYKIVYKNKGNQVENGTINLQFNDAILDFVSSSLATSGQTLNNLNWNYTNLLPLETRTINVILNLNSPMENPAVNANDILNFIATNTIVNIDEMLSDNTFTLSQTVVNSYDPNDKTCLQGNYISPDRVGGYVHYMIRFENTGTFPAQNIVVKDMIDTAKFDVSSLIPLQASHNYVTKISGNKVEFIFENINLPFNDANNDGYIAFKIKTLPSLVLGDTFSNLANIYFDYNFPIITNTATTTVAALSNPSFEFSNYYSLYPNPVANELNINMKSAIEINSIQIYNTIGQLVTVQTGNDLKVDVSHLKTGNYFIKINTNEGYSTSQFIKE